MANYNSEKNEGAPDLHRSRRNGRKGKTPLAVVLKRQMPQSEGAERGVLGCMLLSPNECVGACISRVKTFENVFFDDRNREIFNVMARMYERHEQIDLLTLVQRLKDLNLLEEIGGEAYLASLTNATPSPANLEYYLSIVLDKYKLRRMISTCTEVIQKMYDYEGDVPKLMDEVESTILQVNEETIVSSEARVKDLVDRAIKIIENYHQSKGQLTGISTGFDDLDRITCGLQPGEMIVIAARPSMGKTSLAMNIAEHVAVNQKLPVAVFSLEMTAEALILRMLCSRAGVNMRSMREGFLAARDFPLLTRAAGELTNSPMFIDDTSNMSILQLRARARRMYTRYGIKLFVIDYLQLLHSTDDRARDNRQQEIADISRGIKDLAKELRVPVLVLSQLNRELEKERGRKPRLSDLRESGAIEQDADLVGLLYKPAPAEKSKSDDEDDGPGLQNDVEAVNLYIAKQRNGPTGEIPLRFRRSLTRFEGVSKVDDEDVPQDGRQQGKQADADTGAAEI